MDILVTGGTGYIGGAVVPRLLRDGHDVTVLVRGDAAALRAQSAGARQVRGDLADAASLRAAAAGRDAVVHLAQPGIRPGTDPMEALAGIGEMQRAGVAALAEGLGPDGHLVVTSGAGAYGDTGDSVATEDTPVLAIPPLRGLRDAERTALERERGTVLRPAIVYGGGGGPMRQVADEARAAGEVRFTGDGGNPLTFVHRDDVADLVALVLAAGATGVVNVAAEPYPTQREVLDALAARLGLGPAVPAPPGVAPDGRPPILARTMRVAAHRAHMLGWRPRSTDPAEVVA